MKEIKSICMHQAQNVESLYSCKYIYNYILSMIINHIEIDRDVIQGKL